MSTRRVAVLGVVEQLLERVGRRCAVVVEQPDPLVVARRARGGAVSPRATAAPNEVPAGARVHRRRPSRSREQRRRCRRWTRCRPRRPGRAARVCAASASSTVGQPPGTVVADQERRHRGSSRRPTLARLGPVGRIKPAVTLPTPRRAVAPEARTAQTARFFSLRRSRSERPPQMPNRSSLASAYSRHSSAHVAGQAHAFGLPRRAALLREERLRVGLRAQGALLPTKLLGVSVEQIQLSHGLRPFDP